MLPRPLAVVIVCAPLLAPLPARRGDRLVIWPGHPTHTVATYRARTLQRHRHVPDGVLYGAVLQLLNDDLIRPLSAGDAAALSRIAA